MNKWINCILLIITISSCKELTDKNLRVEKWLSIQNGISNENKHMITSHQFNGDGYPMYITNYSRSGLNMIDSVSFDYSSDKRQLNVFHFQSIDNNSGGFDQTLDTIAHLVFIKNDEDKKYHIVQNKFNTDSGEYHKWVYSNTRFKDTFNLLRNYTSCIENVISVSNELNITPIRVENNGSEFHYSIRYKPSILLEYGIPFDEEMYSMIYSIKDNFLIKDQFNFSNHDVKRSYIYKDGLISKVEIWVVDKKSQKESLFIESFSYVKGK